MPLRTRHAAAGFTLIEMLIALVIAAILASIAWPSYQKSVQRSRRSDAMAALAELSQAQERWRANNAQYQSVIADLPGARSLSAGGHYDIAMLADSTSRTGYIAQATVHSGSPQSGDSTCQMMRLTLAEGQITYGSSNGGSSLNTAPDPCWVR